MSDITAATRFFQHYIDVEWDAVVANANEPDIDTARAVVDGLDALRHADVPPRCRRGPRLPTKLAKLTLRDKGKRRLLAVAEQENSVLGPLFVAYTTMLTDKPRVALADRFVFREMDGRWHVDAKQDICYACWGGRDSCEKCEAAGWLEPFGANFGTLGSPTNTQLIETPTHEKSQDIWRKLAT